MDTFCTYEQHFGLSGHPFTTTPDPGFYFESRGHRRGFAFLRHAVLEGECFMVLTGDIGTGKTATPQLAQDAHAFIKSLLDVPVLYGGSVKPDNAAELLGQPAVDGALVGGAALDVDSFAAICRAASRS